MKTISVYFVAATVLPCLVHANSLSTDAWTNCGGYIFAIPPEKRSEKEIMTICNNYRLQVASFRGQNIQDINAMLWSCGRMDMFLLNNYYIMNRERSSNYTLLSLNSNGTALEMSRFATMPSESFVICDVKSNSAPDFDEWFTVPSVNYTIFYVTTNKSSTYPECGSACGKLGTSASIALLNKTLLTELSSINASFLKEGSTFMSGNDVGDCLMIVAGQGLAQFMEHLPCTGHCFCQRVIQPSVLSTPATTTRALTTTPATTTRAFTTTPATTTRALTTTPATTTRAFSTTPGTTTRTSTTTTDSKSYSSPAKLSTTTVFTQTLSTSTVSPPTIPTTTTQSAATAISAATSLISSRPAATTKHTPSTLVATTGSSSATPVVPTFTASASIPSSKSSGIATTNPFPNTTQWVLIGLYEYFVITREQTHEDAAKFCRDEFNASLVSFASISKYFEIVKPLSLSSDSFWTDGNGTYSSGDPCLALNAKERSLRTINCEVKHQSICTRYRFASNPAEALAYAPFVEMIKEMTVKRNETKISERKYRSAEDRRTVAKASGGVALSLLLGGFALVFVNDIVSMLSRLIRNRSA